MSDYQDLSREELIQRLEALEQATSDGVEVDETEDPRALVHELRVHQIELEMQNRELRELQGQLEASRDRYAELFDFAPVGFLVLDEHGIIQTMNLTAASLLGGERARLTGRPFSAFLCGKETPELFANLRRVLAGQERVAFETSLRRDHEPARTLAVEGVRGVPAEEGRPVARLALTDITERKQAEALRERANRALRALNAVNQAVRHAESESSLLEELCRFLARVAGYALAWVGTPVNDVGQSVRILAAEGATDFLENSGSGMTWGPVEGVRGPFGRAIITGRPAVHSSLPKDPEAGPWCQEAAEAGFRSLTALPLRGEKGPLGVLCIYAWECEAFDDEELRWLCRLADELATGWEALRLREQRREVEQERNYLLEIIEATPDFVGMADAEGNVLYRNPGAWRLLGREPQGSPEGIGVADNYPDWARERFFEEAWPTALREGIWQGELALLHADGHEVPVAQIIIAHRGTDGGVERLSTLAHDLTPFKRQRAEMERSRRLTAMGELGSVLAHQLNQPLSAAASFAEGSLRHFDKLENVSPGLRTGLEKMLEQIHNAGAIVQEVRNFLKGGAPSYREVDVNELIRDLAPTINLGRPEASFRLRLDLAEDLPAVVADPLLIQECAVNLVHNAVDAMAEAGLESPEVRVSTVAEGDRVELRVRDEGPGLPESLAENLDQPLFTTKTGGMGLGLSICRSIADLHGGTLWATRNDPEAGTTFHFNLPVAGKGKAENESRG